MPIYDEAARFRLSEKLGYETWLLGFLSVFEDTFEGIGKPLFIKLVNDQIIAQISAHIRDDISGASGREVMAAITPLSLTTSFKILDMVFEWVLEENEHEGAIPKVPWGFDQKQKLVEKKSLKYPPLFGRWPYVREYSFALYKNLTPYRNEIVHRDKFSREAEGHIRIAPEDKPELVLDRVQLNCMAVFGTALAKHLTGETLVDHTSEAVCRYCLDCLSSIHGLALFGQAPPRFVNVELDIRSEEGVFRVNLERVRDAARRVCPGEDAFISLTVLGFYGDMPKVKWFFPVGQVPTAETEVLGIDSHQSFRLALPE